MLTHDLGKRKKKQEEIMKEKLRIGLLMASFSVRNWEFEMLKRIIDSKYAEIVLLVLDNCPRNRSKLDSLRRNIDRIVWWVYTNIDRILFRQNPDALEIKDSQPILSDIPVLRVIPIRKKFSDYFRKSDLDLIQSYDIDVFIRRGFRILRGDILTLPKYGIWSYHHGDNRINRGGPPCFWECVEDWPETGSILQIINEDLDNGTVIYRSWSPTNYYSPFRNLNMCYWKSLSFLPRKLEELHRIGHKEFFDKIGKLNKEFQFYDGRLFTPPKNLETFRIILRQFYKILLKILEKTFFRGGQWFLLYHFSRNETTSYSLRKFKKIIPPKDRFYADPFIITKNGKYYIFFEEYCHRRKKAHISLIEMDNNGHYKLPEKIIEKSYHLSYPFVFESEGSFYMIPETFENRTIELYECVDFPTKWEFRMNLMENVSTFDTTLFYHNNKWFLFTNVMENEGASHHDELFIFYSNKLLTQNWIPHPLNPVISDVKTARMAGKIFERNGIIYRPSQNCSQSYGYGLNINKIISLNENNYQEVLISSLKPNWGKNIRGVHHFVNEGDLAMMDGCMRRRKYF